MKLLNILFAIGASLLVNASFAQSQQIAIHGQIDGLKKGDTLVFDAVNLPKWSTKEAFRFVATTDNEFQYMGTQPHTQLYLMRYLPCGAAAAAAERMGLPVIVGGEPVYIHGERQNIYHSSISGGDYDEHLRSILRIEDSLGIARSVIMRNINAARAANDSAALKRLTGEFNDFYRVNSARFSTLRTMEAAYIDTHSTQYTAAQLCKMSYKPLEFLQDRYDKLTPEIQKSHYGELLKSIVSKLIGLQYGNAALDFKVTTMGGQQIGLADFKGKYLVVYTFGLCPGSMAIDAKVAKLYANYSDKIEVVGMTDSMNALRSLLQSQSVGANDSIMGMNLKTVLNGMTNHPWQHEFQSTETGNEAFGDMYNIQGLPFFVIISPEGNMVATGFSEVFHKFYDTIVAAVAKS